MPDASPMAAHHFMGGGWMAMLHYDVKAGYDDQWSERGGREAGSAAAPAKLGHDLVLPGDPETKTDVFQGSVGFL